MTDLPTISITLEENDIDFDQDDDSRRPSINECHTDVEDLDSEDQERENSLNKGLKLGAKHNGAVTDVEDFNDSDGRDDDQTPEPSYGPEISLDEFLDQGSVDESSKFSGNNPKKLVAMRSVAKSPSPTAFNLTIAHETGGITDCEDVEASGDEANDSDQVYSEDEKPIVLEGSNAVDIHDSLGNRKKPEKHAPKNVEPAVSELSTSESDEGKPKLRLRTHKHFTKRSNKCEDAKSDVENIFFSDDERRRSRQKSTPVLETPDIEVMAFDGSDHEDVLEVQKFPEINISFAAEEKSKKKMKYRRTPAPSPMLALPNNEDEGHTDVENLNSSDDDDDEVGSVKTKPKNYIPIAIIKSDALTDVEDFESESDDDCGFDAKPDVPLPLPTREITLLVESSSGEPTKLTNPLPDNVLLGFHNFDADKGLTDVEDFSDESGGDDDDEDVTPGIECIPDLDGGVVESSDHTNVNTLRTSGTPDPITDTEDIFMKRQDKSSDCRRRRAKPKHPQHKPKSNFLDSKFYVDLNAAGGHTDVEDLDVDDDDVLLKDKGIKHRRTTAASEPRHSTASNADGKTDIEYISGDDIIDLLRFSPEINASVNNFHIDLCTVTSFRETIDLTPNSIRELKLPERRKECLVSDCYLASTDVEDVQCNSENDESAASYSRAQTATPMELKRDLEELCASEIHETHSRAFDRVKEHFEIKENLCLTESQTDVENFDGLLDEDLPNEAEN